MTRKMSKKSALFQSVIALLLCFSMLIGTTFAWFTDEVSSVGNKIQAGTLQIDLLHLVDGEWISLKENADHKVFDYDLWEPGYTQVETLKIANLGNLAFQYQMNVTAEPGTAVLGSNGENLADVIDVYMCFGQANSASFEDIAKGTSWWKMGTLAEMMADPNGFTQGKILPTGASYDGDLLGQNGVMIGECTASIALHMQETAGNEYQGLSLGDLYINLNAVQYTFEKDSFDDQYDKEATFDAIITNLELSADITGKVVDGKLTEEVVIADAATGITATLPVGTAVTGDTLTLKITEDEVDANVTLDQRVGYDVVVEGVSADNTAPIVILMPKAMPAEQTAIQLYHAGVAMRQVFTVADLSGKEGNNDTYGDKFFYDEATGDVSFSLIHFSNVSMASTTSITVMGKVYTDFVEIVINEDEAKEILIPADGKLYVITHERKDKTTKNALDLTILHSWYNINPGTMSASNIKVEKGAKVVLNGVNIRTSSNAIEALQIVQPSEGRNQGNKTYIYVADGTNNWLTGRSGIGFANYVGADVYVEGRGNIYGTCTAQAAAAFGVSDHSDGNENSMHFNVSHLRAVPMQNGAGIGSGGNCWRCLKLVEFNGNGLYQMHSGGNAASVGGAVNVDWFGEIVVNDTARVHCYSQAWTANWRTMGGGTYSGKCNGVFVASTAFVNQYYNVNANVIVKGFTKLDSITAKSEGNQITEVIGDFGGTKVALNLAKCTVNDTSVTVSAVYDPATETVHYISGIASSATTTADAVKETNFLYRVGNQNNVTKAQIATMLTGKANDGTNVTIDKHVGDAEYNGSKFTGTGLVKVTIDSKEYFLEVVNAKNITKIDSKDTLAENVVLLNDMAYPSDYQSVPMSGNTVFGNGFAIDFTSYYHALDIQNAPIISMQSATLDNVRLIGKVFTDGAYVYHDDAEKANKLENYQSLVVTSGVCKILNSYLSGTRAPVRINGGELTITNSTIVGGNVANIHVKGGTLNLNDVTTVNQGTSVVGFGIFMDNDAGEDENGNVLPIVINVDGLKSYNWLTAADKASMNDQSSRQYMPNMLDAIFTNEAFANAQAINFKMMCLNTNTNVVINGLGDPLIASISGKEGRLWCEAGEGEENAPVYTPNTYAPIEPTFNWNVSLNPNGEYDFSIIQGESGSFENVASALSATKYGVSLGVTYEGTTTYTSEGKYVIKYTITDDQIYDKDGNQLPAKTYTKELTVNVTVSVPETPHPEFTINHWNGSSVTTYTKDNGLVVKQDPNNPKYYYVTAPAGSTLITIDGQAINAINVRGMSSITPESATSFYFYYPVFYGINIVDGEKSYNTATDSFPNDVLTMEYLRSGNPDLITNAKTTSKYEGWMTNKDDQYGYSWTYTNVTSKSYYRADATGTETTLDKLGVSMRSVSYGSNKTITAEDTHYYECVFKGEDGNYYVYYINYFRPYCKSKSCVTGDTLVTLADGSQKRIDEVTYDDQLLVWDFYSGEYAVVPSAIIYYHGDDNYRVLNLHFDDGTTVKVINNHGFFDMEKNEFIFITEENVEELLGDHFAKVEGKNRTAVKLVDYSITEEYTGCYSIETAVHKNFMVEGMFSLTIPIYEGWFDFFEIGENMKYDEEKMQADIEKYGLYTYEDFADYVTYEQFIAFNGPYLKVLVGRGVVTHEQILRLIDQVLHGN